MRRVLRTAIAAVLVFAGGCMADDDPVAAPTETNVVGSYRLTIVNGGTLPFPYSATASARFEIVSGTLTIRSDHTFSDALTRREVSLPSGSSTSEETDTLEGTWTLTGSQMSLTYPGFGTQTVIVTGNRVTRNDQGLLMTYQK